MGTAQLEAPGPISARRSWCHPPKHNSPGAATGPNPAEVRQQVGLRLVRARRKTVGGGGGELFKARRRTLLYIISSLGAG
jgi:hypothetical protein